MVLETTSSTPQSSTPEPTSSASSSSATPTADSQQPISEHSSANASPSSSSSTTATESSISSTSSNQVAEGFSDAAPKAKPTPKQDELNKKINTENEILVSLYRKRDLGQASESDHKEIITRKETLRNLRKNFRSYIKSNTTKESTQTEKTKRIDG